jgi:MoaA/NifB/PqqE/SkfB family radical SAM enzyme
MECAEDKYLWFDTTNNLQKTATSKGIPLMGTFELTPRCNLSCEMCYIRRDASDKSVLSEEKTAEEWISLGEQAAKAGTLFLLLTGGEPFLRPDFKKIYQALSKLGFIITIYSNATLLTPEIVEWLSRTPPNKIEITIYGASADTYAAVTGSGRAYQRALDGVSMLLNAGIETRLRTTVVRSNKYDLKNIAKYAEQLT